MKEKQGNYNTTLILILILIIAFYIRCLHIEIPLLDTHSWRQTQTAMFARNFYKHGYNIFYPQIDWDGKNPGYIESEFQLYPFIVAILYYFFGVKEHLGRLVSVLFSIGSIYFLFLLSKKLLSERVAFFAIIFLTFSPLDLFFSRCFMPEACMLFFSIASIYYFTEYIDNENIKNFILATLCTTLAFLVKIPTLYLGIPLLYLAYRKYKTKLFLQKNLWLFLVLVLLPPILWYTHAYIMGKQSGLSIGIWTIGKDKWGNLHWWLNPQFYVVIIGRIATFGLTIIGFCLFIFGVFLKVKDNNYLFHFWLLSIILYFYAAAFGNIVHSYYQMPLIPVACVFIGKALDFLIEQVKRTKVFDKKVIYLTMGMALVAFIYLSYIYVTPAYVWNKAFYDAALATKKLTNKNDLIIAVDASYPEVLYYSERKGWHLNLEEVSPTAIDNLINKGATHVVSIAVDRIKKDEVLNNYLNTKFELIKDEPEFRIYALKKNTNAKCKMKNAN